MDEEKKVTNFEDFMKELTSQGPPKPFPHQPSQPPSSPPPQPIQTVPPVSDNQPRPPLPQSPAPRPQPVSGQKVSAPKPPPPSPSPSSSQEYQSFLRTMADDMSKLKSGQKLSGLEVQKRISQQVTPITQGPVRPPVGSGPISPQTRPTAPTPGPDPKNLGTLRQEPQKNVYAPGTGLKDSKGNIIAHERAPISEEPPKPGFLSGLRIRFNINKRIVLIAIIGIFVFVGGYYGFKLVTEEPEVKIVAFTPRPSKTPVASKTLNGIFGTISQTGYNASTISTTGLYETIDKQDVNPGQFMKFPIITGSSSRSLGFTEVLEALAAGYQTEINDSIAEDSIVLIYGQKEIFDPTTGAPAGQTARLNRLVMVVEIKDLSKLRTALSLWEPRIFRDLAPIMNIDRNSTASAQISEHVYKDISVHYGNFTYPDRTIDYAVVPGSNQKNYLVLTNSRESMFGTIDRLTEN